MTKLVLVTLLALCSLSTLANTQNFSFTLNGTINTDSGLIRLMPIGGEEFYKTNMDSLECVIVDKKFLITGSIKNSTAFMLRLEVNGELKYISGIFFIDKGINVIEVDKNAIRKTPNIKNTSTNEFNSSFQKVIHSGDKLQKEAFTDIELFYKERHRILSKKLFDYVKKNAKSYVALWYLIN